MLSDATDPDPVPAATYRLQLNRAFTFRDAAALVPYLEALGISHCYASPFLMARPGSSHGYDIIDHGRLNPDIGSQEDFDHFSECLSQCGLRLIADLVPNHMGVMGSENRWWLDVLENGPAADHAGYFDIDWKPVKKELAGKILLPVLGDHYGKVLYRGELVLKFDAARGEFSVWYFDHRFPVDPQEYAGILELRKSGLARETGAGPPCLQEFEGLIEAFRQLPGRLALAQEQRDTRRHEAERCKQRLARLCAECPGIKDFIEAGTALLNGEPGRPENFDGLHALLEAQAWRLSFWKTAADEINYRRFFDINELAGLRTENEEVFEATHRLIFSLVGKGRIAGLRIDHIDGLYDPAGYLERLVGRANGTAPVYLIVEKILAAHERLREDWPVHGTTGYDFANLVNGLFVDPRGERRLSLFYHRFIGGKPDFDEVLYASKRRIITVEMAGELNVLASQLNRISEVDPATRDFTLNSLRHALTEIVAGFPVYRTYVAGESPHGDDRKYIDWAIAQAKKRSTVIETGVFDFIQTVLTLDIATNGAAGYREAVRDFVMHFQQYTAPVMAKGLEDTALYRYNRLVSLNEVGGDPHRFAFSPNAFHYLNQERLQQWPAGMLTTGTHDSKRSEDVRARLNVLSEIPDEFGQKLRRWRFINRRHKRQVDGRLAPSRNDEYLLYQTLLGSWPLQPPGGNELDAYRNRIVQYMLKAVREAKLLTSWSFPNEDYEGALAHFVETVLAAADNNNAFLEDFTPFAEHVSVYGLYNSLAQCLLKLTAPGVPDIYQGNELFEFSLTDPDNRRPVDFVHRQRLLNGLAAACRSPGWEARKLLDNPADGRSKLYLIWKTLNLRRRHQALFQHGDYLPLTATGEHADHVCAFARILDGTACLVVVPRLLHGLCPDGRLPPPGPVWSDTRLELPEPLASRAAWQNALTGETVTAGGVPPVLELARVLAGFPVALLHTGARST